MLLTHLKHTFSIVEMKKNLHVVYINENRKPIETIKIKMTPICTWCILDRELFLIAMT